MCDDMAIRGPDLTPWAFALLLVIPLTSTTTIAVRARPPVAVKMILRARGFILPLSCLGSARPLGESRIATRKSGYVVTPLVRWLGVKFCVVANASVCGPEAGIRVTKLGSGTVPAPDPSADPTRIPATAGIPVVGFYRDLRRDRGAGLSSDPAGVLASRIRAQKPGFDPCFRRAWNCKGPTCHRKSGKS
jgi:hypothetical protein